MANWVGNGNNSVRRGLWADCYILRPFLFRTHSPTSLSKELGSKCQIVWYVHDLWFRYFFFRHCDDCPVSFSFTLLFNLVQVPNDRFRVTNVVKIRQQHQFITNSSWSRQRSFFHFAYLVKLVDYQSKNGQLP